MKNLSFCLIVTLCIVMGSCGAASYKYYVIDRPENRLAGPTPKDDLPLDQTCDPDSTDKAKCIMMFREDFFKAKKELLELREALDQCQRGGPPK